MDENVSNGITVNTIQLNGTNNTGSSYENALKKLIHILKLKSNDKLNQLEKLWDSINVTPISSPSPPPISQHSKSPAYARTSPTQELNTSSIKRDASKLSDVNLDSNNTKRFKTNELSSSDNKSAPTKQVINTKISTTISKSSSSLLSKNNIKTSSNQTTSKNKSPSNIETSTCNDSSNEFPSLEKMTSQAKLAVNNEVVDILDFTCSICKQFNQELNNKLIECRFCTKLYHQMCHMPQIENFEIEQDNQSSDSKSMVWYFKSCSQCLSNSSKTNQLNNSMIDDECTRMGSEHDFKINNINNNTTLAINESKFFKRGMPNTSLANEESSSNSSTSTTNTNTTKQSEHQNQLKTSSSSSSIKGFASLANKFSNPTAKSTSPSQVTSTKANSTTPINSNGKQNHDDLFKKFKLSSTGSNNTSNNIKPNGSVFSNSTVNANNLTSTLKRPNPTNIPLNNNINNNINNKTSTGSQKKNIFSVSNQSLVNSNNSNTNNSKKTPFVNVNTVKS